MTDLRAMVKPCPFCGGDASVRMLGVNSYVACPTCHATGSEGFPERAIAAWNRRAALDPAAFERAVAEAVEQRLRAINVQSGTPINIRKGDTP